MTSKTDLFGQDRRWSSRAKRLIDILQKTTSQLEVRGQINFDTPHIFVANHQGAFPWDALMLAHLNPTHIASQIRPLLEDPIMLAPALGALMTKIGCVRAHRHNAQLLLTAGHHIAVFPEGEQGLTKPYWERTRLKRFGRGGFIQLALDAKVPIVPTTIVGSAQASPLLHKWQPFVKSPFYIPITPTFPWLGPLGALPLPGEWQITFHEPMTSEQLQERIEHGETIGQLSRRVHHQIQKELLLQESNRQPFWKRTLP